MCVWRESVEERERASGDASRPRCVCGCVCVCVCDRETERQRERESLFEMIRNNGVQGFDRRQRLCITIRYLDRRDRSLLAL
jgi:hypothetical protein